VLLIARNEKSEEETRSRKKKPAAAKENQSLVLKERLEAEFAQAVKSAKSNVGNPQRLQSLFQEASKVAASMPLEPVSGNVAILSGHAPFDPRLFSRRLSWTSREHAVVIIAAIIYRRKFPLDLIPTALPALGFLDDVTVLALAVRRSRQTFGRLHGVGNERPLDGSGPWISSRALRPK